jgi:uncharacterized membrane protein
MDNFNWRFIFGIFIVIAYVAISYMIIFTGAFKGGMFSDTVRIMFGIVVGVYGIFRGYRLWKDQK